MPQGVDIFSKGGRLVEVKLSVQKNKNKNQKKNQILEDSNAKS